MKQKLGIARALLHRPSLVFFDEPTAGLDPVAAAALREDLASLASKEGVTVFLTTHNLSEAERLCSNVGVIRQGRLLSIGSPEELRTGKGRQRIEVLGRGFSDRVLVMLRQRPEVLSTSAQDNRLILELKEDADTAPLVSLVVGSGAQVEEVRKSKASLEEVFLKLMEEEKQ
jgi:ABC-2 type transport system ATP-binding protein